MVNILALIGILVIANGIGKFGDYLQRKQSARHPKYFNNKLLKRRK